MENQLQSGCSNSSLSPSDGGHCAAEGEQSAGVTRYCPSSGLKYCMPGCRGHACTKTMSHKGRHTKIEKVEWGHGGSHLSSQWVTAIRACVFVYMQVVQLYTTPSSPLRWQSQDNFLWVNGWLQVHKVTASSNSTVSRSANPCMCWNQVAASAAVLFKAGNNSLKPLSHKFRFPHVWLFWEACLKREAGIRAVNTCSRVSNNHY